MKSFLVEVRTESVTEYEVAAVSAKSAMGFIRKYVRDCTAPPPVGTVSESSDTSIVNVRKKPAW